MTAILDRPDAPRPTASAPAPSASARSPRRRAPRVLAGGAAGVAAAAALAQLVLPGLAAGRVRDRLEPMGTVESVHVAAFPAVKLLWGHADEVRVRMRTLRPPSGGAQAGVGDALARASATDRLEVSVDSVPAGPLGLRDVRVTKRGRALHARATVSDADIARALPPGLALRPVATGDGALVLRGTVHALGLRMRADARVAARDGRLVVRPEGLPFAGAATVTVFSDARFAVRGIHARTRPGGFAVALDGVAR